MATRSSARSAPIEGEDPFATTFRCNTSFAEEFKAVADVDGQTFSDALRVAAEQHVARRKASPEFQAAARGKAAEYRQRSENLLGHLGFDSA